MKVLVENGGEDVELCRELQKIMRRIEESNLHDIEKTLFADILCDIRDAVKIEEVRNG
jgi:hypothetical protein